MARQPTLINTILGSCVAVCLFSPRTGMGAMCHGVMPYNETNCEEEQCFRFVDCSVHYMVDVMVKQQNLSAADIVVKLFGGANVFKSGERKAISVGRQNINAARACLQRYGLKITAEKIGGMNGYKLFFYSHSGEVLLKSIPSQLLRGSEK